MNEIARTHFSRRSALKAPCKPHTLPVRIANTRAHLAVLPGAEALAQANLRALELPVICGILAYADVDGLLLADRVLCR